MCVLARRNVDCLGVGAYDLDILGAKEVCCSVCVVGSFPGSFWIFVYCRISLSSFRLLMFLGFFIFVLTILNLVNGPLFVGMCEG